MPNISVNVEDSCKIYFSYNINFRKYKSNLELYEKYILQLCARDVQNLIKQLSRSAHWIMKMLVTEIIKNHLGLL